MTLARIAEAARAEGLALRGAFHPSQGDGAPDRCGTLVLLGPDEPRFWPIFSGSPEYRDRTPDSMDRWSKRVVGALAQRFGGAAIFPSDGPPYPSFLNWAKASGSASTAPPGMLVHTEAGLLISYRGAIALRERLALPDAPSESPCAPCARPCVGACPVGALGDGTPYDVPACQAHLRSDEGAECRIHGCLVRRACPLSSALQRQPEQAAFHMASFMGNWHEAEGPS
ncbi:MULTISPECIES: ferredoxin [unclassified Salipiger]|uniref:ferredoxin n=1 Tax=Salipiger sp. PrR002 TaxID=2706489 RepID=UPI0013BE090F|nr:ferredoxin [Salipiger sp. PrR002]NDW58980.1 ferredoxin [Salipiger sp. PrR004]